LGEYDLTWWTSHVEKIVEHLRQAAAGKPDVAFFRRIYKPGHAYGGDVVTGWIARLYPYIKNEGIFDRRNPILAIDGEEIDRGLRTDETMPGFSRTKLIVEAQGQPTRKLDLVAGLAGVAQRDDGSVEARAAWFVEESVTHIDELIEELRKHRLPERASDLFPPLEGHAEIIALYSRFDGGTLPFGWSLRPVRKFEECFHQIEPSYYNGPVNLTVFADLPDDSMLAFAYTHIESGPHWGILHLPPQAISEKSMVCAESDVAWVGNSIAEVLLRGFDTNGEDVGMRRGVPSPTLRDFTNYSRTTGR
jgi:hypothetical protein